MHGVLLVPSRELWRKSILVHRELLGEFSFLFVFSSKTRVIRSGSNSILPNKLFVLSCCPYRNREKRKPFFGFGFVLFFIIMLLRARFVILFGFGWRSTCDDGGSVVCLHGTLTFINPSVMDSSYDLCSILAPKLNMDPAAFDASLAT